MSKFRERISFLSLIPDNIYKKIDKSEFRLPNKGLNKIRKQLEEKLGCYVMTYKLRSNLNKPMKSYLCGNIKTAKLNKDQIKILKEYEEKAKKLGASLCVYQKPISKR